MINELLNSTIGSHGNNYGTVSGKDPTAFIVKEILRIENIKIWREYCFKKVNIKQKSNSSMANTFHIDKKKNIGFSTEEH